MTKIIEMLRAALAEERAAWEGAADCSEEMLAHIRSKVADTEAIVDGIDNHVILVDRGYSWRDPAAPWHRMSGESGRPFPEPHYAAGGIISGPTPALAPEAGEHFIPLNTHPEGTPE